MQILIHLETDSRSSYMFSLDEPVKANEIQDIIKENSYWAFRKLVRMSNSVREVPYLEKKRAESVANYTIGRNYSAERLLQATTSEDLFLSTSRTNPQ